jgi:hypothetical protein
VQVFHRRLARVLPPFSIDFFASLSNLFCHATLLLCCDAGAIATFGAFKWLLKADDDTFVRLDVLLDELHQVPPHQQSNLSGAIASPTSRFWRSRLAVWLGW